MKGLALQDVYKPLSDALPDRKLHDLPCEAAAAPLSVAEDDGPLT